VLQGYQGVVWRMVVAATAVDSRELHRAVLHAVMVAASDAATRASSGASSKGAVPWLLGIDASAAENSEGLWQSLIYALV
jgi:hypothetical protein